MLAKNCIALDLEMNQPSGKIIQIGIAIGDCITNTVTKTMCWNINVNETITPYITTLTGITQKDVESGYSLKDAVLQLCLTAAAHDVWPQIIVWGDGDMRCLRKELGPDSRLLDGVFHKRYIDTKTLYQVYRIATKQSVASGLKKSMGRLGMQFEGPAHRADKDAANTLKIFFYFIDKLGEK